MQPKEIIEIMMIGIVITTIIKKEIILGIR